MRMGFGGMSIHLWRWLYIVCMSAMMEGGVCELMWATAVCCIVYVDVRRDGMSAIMKHE